MPRRNKPPYTGVPFTPNVDLAETLREEGDYHGKAEWSNSRKARKTNMDFLPLPGKSIEETLRQREARTGAKRTPGEGFGGGSGGGRNGWGGGEGARGRMPMEVEQSEEKKRELELLLAEPGEFQRGASWQKKKKGSEGGGSSKRGAGERAWSASEQGGGHGPGESGTQSRTSVQGNYSPMGARHEQPSSRSVDADASAGSGEKKRSEALEEKIRNSSRIDPVAFQKLSDRFMGARKENATLKQTIARQKEVRSDMEEHVKKLQHELRLRLESEQV